MITTWTIDQLIRNAADGAVVTAHWRCTAEDGDLRSAAIGPQTFTPDPSAPDFVPYDALTEAAVIGWVKDALGADAVQALEDKLVGEVEALRAPPVVTGLPWAPVPQPDPAADAAQPQEKSA